MSSRHPPDLPRSIPRYPLLHLFRYLLAYPGRFVGSIGLLFFVLSLELTLPRVIRSALNELQPGEHPLTPRGPLFYALLFGGLVVVRETGRFFLGRVRNSLVQKGLADVRMRMFDAIQNLSFTFHDRSQTGELISRGTSDVNKLREFFVACLLHILDIGGALGATIILIFMVNTQLGFAICATIIPTVLLIAHFARRLQPMWRKVHDLHSSMTTVVQENIAGVRVVKAFAKEGDENTKFRAHKEDYLRQLLKAVNYWAGRVPFAQFIYGLSLPLVLALGGRQVIMGTMRVGDLSMVVLYLMSINNRIGAVGQLTSVMQQASASAERVLEIIHAPREIVGGDRPVPKGAAAGAVKFEDVSFSYQDGHASLSNVSFEVPAGKTIAIVGPTGSGKSTLISLIPRFYDAGTGTVKVGGVPVRDLQLDELRGSIGMIFQETLLFSATVADNIAFGRPDATREEIIACAKHAQAHEFIMQLAQGYDTIVGERGASLSGGQKQRLAIARAFIMNPQILIMDDATAAVDSGTERQIQDAMREVCKGRTAFIIAHRLTTVQHADTILVLNEGRIVERGKHEELLARGGFYRQVAEQQIHGEKYGASAIANGGLTA